MDVVLEVLRIIGIVLLGAFSLLAALGIIGVLIDVAAAVGRAPLGVRRRRKRRRHHQRRRSTAPPVPPPCSPETPSFAHVLLVDVDERAGVVAPVVELGTNVMLRRGRLRIELVDVDGRVRAAAERRLPRAAGVTRARFDAFAVPDGSTIVDVLGWRWDVVLLDASGERARWREALSPAGAVDAEAELVLAAGDPRPVSLPTADVERSTVDFIQLLREAARRARAADQPVAAGAD